uniref:Uncharacterized protein n=1 Tax=Amphora coffeiformis TaxID=265554 RepID=A0A7S3P6W0_9STRA|eukprot:scaffold5089_cov156-Amphora_coffeaeformis.AAC.6
MDRMRLEDLDALGEDDLRQRMAGLQLPHMPEFLSAPPDQEVPATLPTIRVLVVADLDLPSAAALAEYTLQQRNQVFDATRIDLCIACGPFSRDEDLRAYQSRRQRKRNNKTVQQSPFVRSREETAALEGLVTAALSQLENIVCRVVFCPGSTDPITTILPGDDGREKLRLTPNSRNIHQQWLPLAPSLGCAGLLYLESPEKVVPVDKKEDPQAFTSDDDSEKEEDEETVEDILSEQIVGMQQSPEGYCSTLGRLLELAPPVHPALPFLSEQSQTILVTHYADLDNYDDAPANGSPSWAIEESRDLPWPMQDHDTFLNSLVANNLLCLEIASGSSAKRPPEWRKHRGGTSVLLPGSLRERGEFCLVDLAIVPANLEDSQESLDAGNSSTKFAWKVTDILFHSIDMLP